MKRIANLVLGCVAVMAQPAFAQRSPERPSYDDRSSRETPDIGRQIRELDDSIYAADRERRISPSQADAYIRELREIESQLLDVRARTFSQPMDGDGLRPAPAPSFRGTDTGAGEGDQQDSREPPPAPDPRDGGNWSAEHL